MIVTPKQLAEALGITDGTMRKHVFRGKVVKSGKYIDLNHAVNKEYILNQTDGKGLDYTKIPKGKTTKTTPVVNEEPGIKLDSIDIPTPSNGHESSLLMEKRKMEIQKLKSQIRMDNMKYQKMKGELLPTELVEKIMTINMRSLLATIEHENENLASVWVEVLGGNRTHLTKMISEMRTLLQRAVEDGREKSAQDIKAAIKEYALVREYAEKKKIENQVKMKMQ